MFFYVYTDFFSFLVGVRLLDLHVGGRLWRTINGICVIK